MNREDSGEQMVIRKASGAGENADISGDYNVYNETSTVTVGEYTVTLKGNDQKVNLATWTSGDYAYSYLHNLSDSEEILQDTLIQFMKSAPTFTSESHRKAWLLRVAGNLSKNRISYNAIRQTDELKEELVQEEREDLSFVWDAVKDLPVKYREVIHLFYYEGYSTAQIAQVLEKNETTVRSLLSRGRKQLKQVLKEAYDFAD